jgi:hypothetical protein
MRPLRSSANSFDVAAGSPPLTSPRLVEFPLNHPSRINHDHLWRYNSHRGRVESEWIDWMQRIHVPDVLRTGCFSECHACKVIESNDPEPTYVLQYQCPSLEQYYHYRDNFAPGLQKDHSSRFAGRFRASRQLLE